jgi:hypothetical protein
MKSVAALRLSVLASTVVICALLEAPVAIATPKMISPPTGMRAKLSVGDGHAIWLEGAESSWGHSRPSVVVYDLSANTSRTISEANAVYAQPCLGQGWAYWVENAPDGTSPRLVALNLASGERRRLFDGDVTGLNAKGDRVAWLSFDRAAYQETYGYFNTLYTATSSNPVPRIVGNRIPYADDPALIATDSCVVSYYADGYHWLAYPFDGSAPRDIALPAGARALQVVEGNRLLYRFSDQDDSDTGPTATFGVDVSTGETTRVVSMDVLPLLGRSPVGVPIGGLAVGAYGTSVTPGSQLFLVAKDLVTGVYRMRWRRSTVGQLSVENRVMSSPDARWCDGTWAVWTEYIYGPENPEGRVDDLRIWAEPVSAFDVIDRPVLTSQNASSYTLYIKKVPGVHAYRARSLTFSALVRDKAGRPLAGRSVQLEMQTGGSWRTMATVKSGSTGRVSAKAPACGGLRAWVLWSAANAHQWRWVIPASVKTFPAAGRTSTVRVRRGSGTLLRSEL